ncbi:MAG: Hint domain-containing protein [Rhodobacteraceae bacterium]|nr:Hint domain-containing protein [Paracoccaceae bacterium]
MGRQVSDSQIQNILALPSAAFRVSDGANEGDALSIHDEIEPDDIYQLDDDTPLQRLALDIAETGGIHIAPGTAAGRPGAPLHLDCALVLMTPDGATTDAIVLVELTEAATIAAIYLLPLAALHPRLPYRVVSRDRQAARRFAQVACSAFTRGTRITMASGAQMPIEDLTVGDRVLTRDGGARGVRWIGQTTVRATGDFAPVMIRAGALNNAADLVVSPNHRLFVYQRTDRIGAGKAELLVQARHLVNGDSVIRMDGGFVDYFQILFDRHHILYAEGIAAESTLAEPRTLPALPAGLTHRPDRAHGLDVQQSLLDRPDAIDLLRRASTR